MGESARNIPASRGRIIKRGSLATTSRAPALKVHRGGRADSDSRGSESRATATGSSRKIWEILFTVIVVPTLFAASVAFMWSRPIEEVRDLGAILDPSHHSRFQGLSNQISRRFNSAAVGVVLEPKSTSKSTHKAPTAPNLATVIAEKSAPVTEDVTEQRSADEVAAIENHVYKILKRYGKPVHNGRALASAIVKEALEQSYDPVFVAAVIKSESAFNTLARSNKGAQGLMQIMPKTGAWLADKQSIPRRRLTEPGHNLKLGITYLKQLEREYNGNRVLTLIAYNWGPGHVESASAGSRRVPGEVMQYAVKILNDYRRWQSEIRSSVG